VSSISDLFKHSNVYFSGVNLEMLQFIPVNASRVLDVGCGAGSFGKLLKQNSQVEVWGLELDKGAAAEASKVLDNVIVGDATSELKKLPDRSFDAIIFNDVLEHLYDPYSLLVVAKDKLSYKGLIVCSIPNVRFYRTLYRLLVKKDWKYEELGILDKTHIRFFTKASIQCMFAELGFDLIVVKGINRAPIRKALFISIFGLGMFQDSMYPQFACVARPTNYS